MKKKQVKINFQNFNLKFFEKRKKYSFSRCLWKNNKLNIINITSIKELNKYSILIKED